MINITSANFKKEVTDAKTPVIIDFWASWCGPCQMLGPIFEKTSKHYEGKLKFAKCSTEEEGEFAGEHLVMSIPCMILFNKGKEVGRIIGAMQEKDLIIKIDALLQKV